MRRSQTMGSPDVQRISSSNDKDFAWRSFSLKTIQHVPDHAWHRLTLLSACLYGAIAPLIPGYGWEVRAVLVPAALAILYAGIVLSRPMPTSLHPRHQPWEFLTAQILFSLPVLFSVTWLDKDGFPFILTGRESFLTFLAAHNARSFHSLIIQDIAVASADGAHPFFYLNHPNLPSRLVSVLAQAAGLDLSAQLLLAMCISAVALLAAYVAFRHYVSPAFAFALIAFLGTSYATFLPKAFDLLWSVNIAMFWFIVYFLLRDSVFTRVSSRMSIAMLTFFVALSDWGFLLFVATLVTLWMAYHHDTFPWRMFILVLLVPIGVAIGGYTIVIIEAVGIDVLASNVALNVVSRLGHLSPGFLEKTGLIDAPAVSSWLRDHNVTVLPRGPRAVSLTAFLEAYWAALGSWLGILRFPLALMGLAGAGEFVLLVMKTHRIPAFIAAASVLLVAMGRIPPIFLLLASGALLWCLIRNVQPVPAFDGRASSIRQRLNLWITLVFASLVTTFAVLPSYTVHNTLNSSGMNLPAGLVESALFAGLGAFLAHRLRHLGIAASLLVTPPDISMERHPTVVQRVRTVSVILVSVAALGLTIATVVNAEPWNGILVLASTVGGLGLLTVFWPRVGYRWFLQGRAVLRHHSAPSLAAALILAVMVLAHVSWNYRFYSVNRPRPYPFMRVLSQNQFWGRSFVTNNDDAAVWYVTRGWAYSISSAEPFYFAHAPQKYFADWRNNAKYEHPDFYLCDYSRFTPWINLVDHPTGRKFHDCLEVAEYLSTTYGYHIIDQHPRYAVLALR